MNRPRAMVIASVLFACIVALEQPVEAGKVFYSQCFTALGDMADAFKAQLITDGLFYVWGGYSVKEPVREGQPCMRTNPMMGAPPDLFRASNAAGVNSINEALAKIVPINGHMLFNSLRNDKALDPDPMKTTFTLKGNDIGTKFGKAATKASGDPIIDVTNGGSSLMTILSIVAQINNSEDPLDPSLSFLPDGIEVLAIPSSLPIDLLPRDTAEFSFSVDGSPNWSFQYSYSLDGDTFVDLLASDVAVPAPHSLSLLVAGIVALMIVVIQHAHSPFASRGKHATAGSPDFVINFVINA